MSQAYFYKIGELSPDSGWLGTEGLGYCNNLVPVAGGYSPGPAMMFFKSPERVSTDPLDGEILGGIVDTDTTKANLYLAMSGGTDGYCVKKIDLTSSSVSPLADDLTPASGWSQGTGNDTIIETWGVQFAIFGSYVYMTDGISGLFRSNGTADFTIISPATGGVAPVPKVIASFGGHLICGDIYLSSPHGGVPSGRSGSLLWWSAFDDPQTYGSLATTPQHKGTDYKFLYDTPGNVVKIVPAGDVVFAFKEKAIYIGEGPPFRWNLISNTIGCQFPNSIGYYNNGVFFMSDSGPAFIGRDGIVKLLLQGKAQRALIGTNSAFSA